MVNAKILCWGPNATYIPLTGGFVLGITQILGLASGVMQIFTFLDTNMLVSPMQNSAAEGLDQRKAPPREFYIAVEYRLYCKQNVTFLDLQCTRGHII